MTPDQDVVDEMGAALGVQRDLNDEVVSCVDILMERDRDRWRREGETGPDEESVR